MNIKDNLISFLYDKNYFITKYDDYIHLFNYQDLIILTDSKIVLKFDSFIVTIKGCNLLITKMLPNEMLIKGKINNIGFEYE